MHDVHVMRLSTFAQATTGGGVRAIAGRRAGEPNMHVLAAVSPCPCNTRPTFMLMPAERFKGIVGRMALVKECTSLQLTDTLDTAADAYALAVMLSMVAADEQFLQFTW